MPLLADYDSTYDPAGDPGGGGLGSPPPDGSDWALTKRWADVRWQYTEPAPAGACTGFDVAIYAVGSAGLGPDAGVLAAPIETLESPAARRHVALLELRTAVGLRAAVRARYGALRSAWAVAALAAQFTPDATPRP
jgi:hypothetical protein